LYSQVFKYKHGFRVLENRVLRRIVRKEVEITGR
jgi:hypothetical protein